MATEPKRVTRENKWTSMFGPTEPNMDLMYGPGSIDYGMDHRFFKRFGGPEAEVPQPNPGNKFWNDLFKLSPQRPGPLNYEGPEAPMQQPNWGPMEKMPQMASATPQKPRLQKEPTPIDKRPYGPDWKKNHFNLFWNPTTLDHANEDLGINDKKSPFWRSPKPKRPEEEKDPNLYLHETPPWGSLDPDPLMQLFLSLSQGQPT